MFCSQCGKEISENSVFCQFCGAQVKDQKQEEVIQVVEKSNDSTLKSETGPWKNFANVGLTLGIVAISTFFLIIPAVMCGIPGIVFSALGKRSEINESKATTGLVLSILGTILAISFPVLLSMFILYIG